MSKQFILVTIDLGNPFRWIMLVLVIISLVIGVSYVISYYWPEKKDNKEIINGIKCRTCEEMNKQNSKECYFCGMSMEEKAYGR